MWQNSWAAGKVRSCDVPESFSGLTAPAPALPLCCLQDCMNASSSGRRIGGIACTCWGMSTSLISLPTVGIERGHVPRCLHLPVMAKPAPAISLVPPKPHCLAESASEDGGMGQVAGVAADSVIGALCAALPKQLAAKCQPNKWLDCPVISY